MSAHSDTAFLRMFLIILGALLAFTVIIMIAANVITGSVEEDLGEDPRLRAKISERIKPVGAVNVAVVAAAPAAPKSGAEVVAAACNSCHGTGVLDAPKIGDAAAWSQRLASTGGIEGLTSSAIKGKGAMPPNGGAMVSEGEIRAAVEHMLAESGVDAGAAPAAAPAAAAEPVPAPAGPVAAVQEMAGTAVEAASAMVAAAMPAVAPTAEPAAAPAVDLAKGKSVYGTACFVCHGTGAAGAPKLGDTAVWAPRIAQGLDVLYTNAIKGKGAMPPKGGRMDMSDDDIRAAAAYMVSESE